jgi:hypothetical protein
MTVVDFDDTIFAGDEEDTTNRFENEIYFEPRIEEMGKPLDTKKPNWEGMLPQTKKKKTMPEKNQNFKDIEETGKWGSVSRREIICCSATAVAIVVGIVVALVVVLKGRDSSIVAPPPPQTTLEEVYVGHNEQYVALRAKVADSSIQDLLLPDLPRTFSMLEASEQNSPIYQAISWLLKDDPIKVKIESDLIPRFVLAVLYFSHRGDLWKDSTNWMTDQSACVWKGIVCDSQSHIIEIDLSNNGLTGELPMIWGLLEQTTSLMLNMNQIVGSIPGEALGRMSNLTALYLQDNLLTVSRTFSLLI